MDDVRLDDVTDEFGTLAVEGPQAARTIEKAYGFDLNEMPDLAIRSVHIDSMPCEIIRRSHFGYVGMEVVAPQKSLKQIWENLLALVRLRGGLPVGMKALETLRLEVGIPFYPVDFNDTVIPHEAAVETTHISFTKGCYTGQEIVERVRSRGQVNRRRVRLKFSTPNRRLPARGSAPTAKNSASSPAPPFRPKKTPPSAWAIPAANTTLPAASLNAKTEPPKSSPSR